MNYLNILKGLFKDKPSLEDFIAAHEPTDIFQVEFLEKEYARFMESKNFWGSVQ
jgi:hypothetical protein